jgi:outer membrane lipoprotein-sorting protein
VNGFKKELQGSVVIGDEDCYIVYVDYDEESEYETTWYLSKKDFLPRRRLDHITLQNGDKGGTMRTVTNLKVEPDLSSDTFKIVIPEGYTESNTAAQ